MSPYVFNTVLFPSYFVRVPSYFEALWYPHLYFDRKSNIANPMREIQRFPNLGHNLCENDKQTLHDYIWALYTLTGSYKYIQVFTL